VSLYPVIETLVIGGALAFSADQALRQLAPAARRAVLGWFAARLGLRPPTAPPAKGGCDSGCGTCGTGCGSSTTPTAETGEQPLQFVRKTPAAKP
jgi:hypothetical protein